MDLGLGRQLVPLHSTVSMVSDLLIVFLLYLIDYRSSISDNMQVRTAKCCIHTAEFAPHFRIDHTVLAGEVVFVHMPLALNDPDDPAG